MLLRERAPAKVNLTLHVTGRRADGYHALESLVAFSSAIADTLVLDAGPALSLDRVDGPFADGAGPAADNLVLRAARAAAERIEGLKLGAFVLTKHIPAAAGLGGGSADAAAALRLIARLNGLAPDDPRLRDAAEAAGSDVPVCLEPLARLMEGRGEAVSRPLDLPPLAAVLANPGRAVATADVFRSLGLAPGETLAGAPHGAPPAGADLEAVLAAVAAGRNDLEPAALKVLPAIGDGLAALRVSAGCRLARMSGSGATVFGLYPDLHAATRAARAVADSLRGWWVRATVLR